LRRPIEHARAREHPLGGEVVDHAGGAIDAGVDGVVSAEARE